MSMEVALLISANIFILLAWHEILRMLRLQNSFMETVAAKFGVTRDDSIN